MHDFFYFYRKVINQIDRVFKMFIGGKKIDHCLYPSFRMILLRLLFDHHPPTSDHSHPSTPIVPSISIANDFPMIYSH